MELLKKTLLTIFKVIIFIPWGIIKLIWRFFKLLGELCVAFFHLFKYGKYAKLSLRNLVRERKRSALLVGAIAFGIMIVTIVNCATDGAIKAISENITRMADGHIFIQGEKRLESDKVVQSLTDKDEILKIIEESGITVEKLNKRSEMRAELIFGDNSNGANISGMNWDVETEVINGFKFKEGSLDRSIKNGLIVNEKLAENLDVHIGDTVIAKLRTVTGQTNVGDFIITGILQGTDILTSMNSYTTLEFVNEMVGIDADDYLTLYLRLPSLEVTDGSADILYDLLKKKFQMKKRLDNSDIDIFSLAFSNKEEDWDGQRYVLTAVTEMVGFLDQFVGVVKYVSVSVLILLFIIIVVGVVNTFRMIMYDRVKEIGSMRAMGMQRHGIKTIFIYEGIFLAIAGSLLGIIVASILMFIASFIDLGMDHAGSFFLNNGHLLFLPAIGPIIGNTLAVALITALAVFFPAKKAGELDPAKAIASMY